MRKKKWRLQLIFLNIQGYVEMHTYNPSALEAGQREGESGQAGQHSKTLSHRQKIKRKKKVENQAWTRPDQEAPLASNWVNGTKLQAKLAWSRVWQKAGVNDHEKQPRLLPSSRHPGYGRIDIIPETQTTEDSDDGHFESLKGPQVG